MNLTLANQMAADVLHKFGGNWVDARGDERSPGELSAIVLPEGVRGRGIGVVEFEASGAVYECYLERIGDRFLFEIGRQLR